MDKPIEMDNIENNDNTENENKKYTSIKIWNKEYKIFHKNKKNMNNNNLNYLSILLYIIKNALINLLYYLEKIYFFKYLEILIMIIVLTLIPSLVMGCLLSIVVGIGERIDSITYCNKDYKNCDTYRKFCYNELDFDTELSINRLRISEIKKCIEINTFLGDFILSSIYSAIYYIFNALYYIVIIFTSCYFGYYFTKYLINIVVNKLEKAKKILDDELPKIEEV